MLFKINFVIATVIMLLYNNIYTRCRMKLHTNFSNHFLAIVGTIIILYYINFSNTSGFDYNNIIEYYMYTMIEYYEP